MAPHAGCCLSGHMHIVMNDGEAAAGRDHERLRTHHVGEIRTNPLATAPGVEEVDEIPAPRPAPPDELEILTGQRIEQMHHAAAGISSSTVELTWALILAHSRHLVGEVTALRAGGWQSTVGRDLAGATLGGSGFCPGSGVRSRGSAPRSGWMCSPGVGR